MDTVTEQTLRDLIASGETLTVEFKSDLKQAKQANKRTLSDSLSVFRVMFLVCHLRNMV